MFNFGLKFAIIFYIYLNIVENILKKTAFSLSEVMIALTIIGVIMALVIPVVINSVSDTNGLQYKKVIKDLQNAIEMVKEGPSTYSVAVSARYSPVDFFLDVSPKNFCKLIAGQLSTVGSVNCNIDSSDTSKTSNFQQMNGVEYWNIGGPSSETSTFKDKDTGEACSSATSYSARKKCVRTIWVDINGTAKDKNVHGKDQFRLQIRYDGKIMLGTGGDWDTIEQKVLQDSNY